MNSINAKWYFWKELAIKVVILELLRCIISSASNGRRRHDLSKIWLFPLRGRLKFKDSLRWTCPIQSRSIAKASKIFALCTRVCCCWIAELDCVEVLEGTLDWELLFRADDDALIGLDWSVGFVLDIFWRLLSRLFRAVNCFSSFKFFSCFSCSLKMMKW